MSISKITLCALVAFVLSLVVWTVPVAAQSLIPGIPSTDQSSSPAPASDPAALDQLIETLKNETSRNELISQLEATRDGTTGAATAEPAAQPAAPEPFLRTALREIESWFRDEVPAFLLRLQRIPTTLKTAERGLSWSLLRPILRDIGIASAATYGCLLVLRLLSFPIYRKLRDTDPNQAWIRIFFRRCLATLAAIFPIFLAGFAGAFAVVMINGVEGEIPIAEATFFAAFVPIELCKAFIRFILSAKRPNLRLIRISDEAATVLQRISIFTVTFLGYGQLLFVPVIENYTSVFIARAVSTVIGAITVLYLMGVLFVRRDMMSKWLRTKYRNTAAEEFMDWLARVWHIPVLVYLICVLLIVMTRPGNVLLPLIETTGVAMGVVIVGGMVFDILDRLRTRSIRLPKFVNVNLPMLETRLNRVVPAALLVLKIITGVLVIAGVVSIIGIYDFFAFFATEAGGRLLAGVFGVLVLLAVIYAVNLVVASWVDYKLNPFVGEAPTARSITLLTLMRNAITITLIAIGGMLALSQLGLNIGPILASAGVLGLAISFGAQKMVEDIITGVFIQFENAMNVGDVVNAGGVIGTVERLTVRSVTLRDLQGVVHMVPFSATSGIANYMREFSYYVCDMGVAYREDIDDVKKAMFDAYEDLRNDPQQGPYLLEDLEWMGLDAFGDSAIVLRARIKTLPGMQWGVKRAYNTYLKAIFDAREIEIPFPHQTIYFGENKDGSAPAARVEVEEVHQTDAPKPVS